MPEAVRRAIAEIGHDAKAAELADFIKSQFGIRMTPPHIATYKTRIVRKGGSESAIIRRPQVPAAAPATMSGGITVEEIRAVKEVVDRLGAEKVRELTEVLSG